MHSHVASSTLQELGSSATFVPCDVTQEADLAGAVQAAINTFGSLDVMCNNAGVLSPGDQESPLRATGMGGEKGRGCVHACL